EDDYRYREFTQAGLELIGEKSYLADAEVIMLAVDALKAAGLTDFLIEVGNTEFFRGLIEECGLLKRDEEELIRNVDKKNNLAITETLKNAGTVKSLIDVITKLPTLFGDDAVKDAYGLVKNKKSLAALDEIGKLCDILRSSGYEKYVSVDLSLLNNMNFYTGTIFKGITSHFGAPILSGGRYNNLFTSAKGGEAIPATGFAVGIKNLLTALKASGQTVKKPPCDYVIGAKKKYAEKAFETKKKLTEQGFIVNYTFIDDENKLAKYAKETAARNIIFIDR
ncbi:MAG: ATP phosphoribosyltransferase regulatory subunit, partial [Clostridiales bacterium]|nr:ATP phosphoribosyltransferase regulatory subunit [Clostridiales bacterium]